MMFRSLALAATLLGSPSNASPTEPGGCASPNPFLPSPHRARNQDGNGTLADGGFTVMMGDIELDLADTNTVPAGEYAISLSGGTFLGFLFRLTSDDVDDTTTLISTTDANVSPASACTPMSIGSLGHVDNSEKTEVTGTINWPSVTEDISLEVSVVVSNTLTAGSVWYTSAFVLETTEEAAAPTMAPMTDAPTQMMMNGTEAPTDAMMMNGTEAPTDAMMMNGTEAPSPAMGSTSPAPTKGGGVVPPTDPPTATPSVSPVPVSDVPSMMPSAVATNSSMPSLVPSADATEPPSSSPSKSPTKMPTANPTLMPVSAGTVVAMKQVVTTLLAMGLAAVAVLVF